MMSLKSYCSLLPQSPSALREAQAGMVYAFFKYFIDLCQTNYRNIYRKLFTPIVSQFTKQRNR